MNFLAHFLLSGNNKELILGNFLGDFIRGRKLLELSRDVQKGVTLHREIDRYTDHHGIIKDSVSLLQPSFGRYSGVALDIFFDHFLAVHWGKFHSKELDSYAKSIYSILKDHKKHFPEKALMFYRYMRANNILFYYKELEGIDFVMKGMARRTSYNSNFETAKEVLESNYFELESYFLDFMPELQRHIEQVRIELEKSTDVTVK